MKKLILGLTLALTMMGCSSGSSGNAAPAGNVTVFEQNTSGEWHSECAQDQNGNYLETLVINKGGTGSSTFNYYQNTDCSGAVVGTQGPFNFTYKAEALNAGSTKVTLTVEGRAPTQLTVTSENNAMTIVSEQGTVHYFRVGQAPGLGQNPAANPNDFDSLAKGSWATENCYQGQSQTTVRQVITIQGQGRAASVLNVYQSANCSGPAQATQHQEITYQVDRFANGGGQLTVNGQMNDITFQANKMTISSNEGTTVFIRVQ